MIIGKKIKTAIAIFLLSSFFVGYISAQSVVITGEKKVWYPVTLTFEGPSVSEAKATFTDYRLDVTFTKGTETFVVPGYFAADGDAANTSATSGNKWRVKFTPNDAGTWNYTVSFRTGSKVAVGLVTTVGTGGTLPDGQTGSFDITVADAGAPGFYSKGMLRYVGERYLQFQGNDEWFVKGGQGSPEDFFGYQDFDDTYDGPRKSDNTPDTYLYADHGFDAGAGKGLHRYLFHLADWQAGDPSWKGDKGKGIIGALNYLSSIGANTIYHIFFTRNDDSDNTWPWTGRDNTLIYDVSKLDQYSIVYEYMDRIGINADFYTCESDNCKFLNDGDMGVERCVYYREIVARFGFKLAIRYNLGEENSLSTAQLKANADYLAGLDPYNHPVGSHCNYNSFEAMYNGLLGYKNFDGAWMQLHDSKDIHLEIKKWIDKSADAGHKWVVSDDEWWPTDETNENRSETNTWKVITAGGEGSDLYIGYKDNTYSDVTLEDFRRMTPCLKYLISARTLFSQPEINQHLTSMASNDILVGNNGLNDVPFCFAEKGIAYVIYSKSGSAIKLDLSGLSGTFNIKWWDPRKLDGGGLQNGSIVSVDGGSSSQSLGTPPYDTNKSWAVLVTGSGGAVTGISINNCPSAKITKGLSHKMKLTFSPANADNKSVIWSSSNNSVATVNSLGLVKAISIGSATITVKTAEGNFTDSCLVEVEFFPVTDVSINGCPSGDIFLKSKHQLSAIVSPANASIQKVTWQTSNVLVAKVDTMGLVKAISVGSADITATTLDGGFISTCTVNVKDSTVGIGSENLSFDANTLHTVLYPNPFNNGLLNVSSNIVIDRICIFDLTGKLVFKQEDIFKTVVKINLENLEKGMYLIEIESKKTKEIKKMVIR